jgi:negative regulator of replication initiation/plasmid maintenance system antidote protein VapI
VAQYDVDINLALKGTRELKLFDDRLKQLTAKLEELDRVQNDIGKRNPYSAAGKRVTQFGKEIDEAREIVEFFAQSNRDAAASMDDLLRKQSSFNNFFKQAADVRQAIQAANKADQQAARQQRMRTLGNATSSALIGGGFPLLFGQGGAAAAGGALGGLAGGAVGGGFGFALSIVGTALGQAIADAEEFNSTIVNLNSGLDGTATNASITSAEISELASQMGLAKDETVELLTGFKNLGANTDEVLALAQVFGDDASTVKNLAAAKKLSQVGEAIFANVGKITRDKALQLINELKIKDAQVVQLGLIEALAEAEERREVSQARQVKFTDRLTASFLIMGAGAEGAALAPILTAEDIANQRADKLQGELEEARNERLKNAAEFIKKLREVFSTIEGLDPDKPKKPKGDPTINLQKRLNILNKQITSEEKFVGVSSQGAAIIRRKLALESKIAKIQEAGTAERKRLTDQEDISLSKSIQDKAIKLENLKFEREATALIERQNKAGERLLEPLQRKIDAIRDRNAFEKEYGDLIMKGSTPAAAKQVIEAQKQKKEIDRLVEKQLESNEILIANLRIKVAETEGTKAHTAAVNALNDALERRNKIEEKGRVAKGEIKGEKTPAERFEDEIKAIQGIINELNDPVRQAIELSRTLGSAFSESFRGIVSGSMTAQQALANLFQRTADHFLDMAAQMIAAQLRMQAVKLFMSFFPSTGIPASGSANPFPGHPTHDNVPIPPLPPLPGKALGGAVGAGRPYMVGERGPELFVPGAQGNIVPNNAMGGSSIVVNVDASGSSVEGDSEQAAQLGKMLGAAVQAELIKQKRPGGLLAS